MNENERVKNNSKNDSHVEVLYLEIDRKYRNFCDIFGLPGNHFGFGWLRANREKTQVPIRRAWQRAVIGRA